MTDIFASYERGLTVLVRWLSSDHPRHTEALTFQSRLMENIQHARRHGDTETRRADRAQIVEQLNDLAFTALGTSFNELCEYQDTPSPSESADVRGLLEAMGYRIVDSRAVEKDLYFLCDVRWGAEICQEVVHLMGGEPRPGDIAALNDAVTSHDAIRGILLTQNPLPSTLRELADQRRHIRCYTLNEFTDRLADFCPYLEQLIQEYEASEIPVFYVPLAAESEMGEGQKPQVFKPLESFVDAWLIEPGRNHLSILGDFGSGKTWFCQRYAYLVARRYLADPAHNRIPILITLRDYSRAYDVEQLITDAVANRYKVSLAAGYKTFARLNEAGRLLLIFDGFDEMERRVSDYRTTVDNFWEMAKVVHPSSKVLLTCRTAYFRHQGEEAETLTRRRRRVSMAAGDQVIDLSNQDQFEVVHLLDFGDEDIRLALQKRLPADWQSIYEKTWEITNLRDLASRPVLLDMIVKTLPQLQDARQINQASLYEAYVDTLLRRRWSEDADYISPQDRLFFVQELAWEMYQTQRLNIPFSEFPERVTRHFGFEDDPRRAAFFERDVRTQSYLVRDEAGNYRFAHKSFMEYFVARKMADSISQQDFEVNQAVTTWKTHPLSPEVRDFLLPMIASSSHLWKLIEVTRDKPLVDVAYAGGNAITILRLMGESLERAQLSDTVLMGADLFSANLAKADLSGSCLREANLSGSVLKDADLRGADLTASDMSEIVEIRSVAYGPLGHDIACGCDDGSVRIWSVREIDMTTLRGGHKSYVRSVCFRPPAGEQIASSSVDGSVAIWDLDSGNLVAKFELPSNTVHRLSFDSSGQLLAYGGLSGAVELRKAPDWSLGARLEGHQSYVSTVCFSPDGKLLSSGSYDGTILLWNTSDGKKLFSLPFGSVLNKVAFSQDGHMLATCGDAYEVVIWKTATGKPVARLDHQEWVFDIAYSTDGVHLATGDMRGVITIWDTSTNEQIRRWQAHQSTVRALTYSPDGMRLASGGLDGTVRIWNSDPKSNDFGKRLMSLELIVDCQGARIGGAKGLDALAPDRQGTLGDWLIARGAAE